MNFLTTPEERAVGIFAALDLCEVNTLDGPARFILGADGVFTDINGNTWVGSQLGAVSSLGAAIGGEAPEGEITLSYFQDPDADDLIAQLIALGVDYVGGQEVRFYVQTFASHAEFYAPVKAPVLWLTRIARKLTFSAGGAQDRSITLSFEAWSENRMAAGRTVLNTKGHAKLIGEENPSLTYIPTTDFQEQKLFG